MRISFTLILIGLSLLTIGQVDPQRVLSQLEGHFKWEMLRPSNNSLVRTGSRSSERYFDHALFIHETFDDSSIEQIGIIGFDDVRKEFYSIGVYNQVASPYLHPGDIIKEKPLTIRFFENDTTRVDLTIFDKDKHQWQGFRLRKKEWEPIDLLIVFEK